MMRRGALLYIVLAILLGGCTQDITETNDDKPINRDGSIAFRSDSIISRGTPQDNLTAYDKLNMFAYSHKDDYSKGKTLYRKTQLSKTGNASNLVWDYAPRMFWPSEHRLSFLAYAIESKIPYATASGQPGVYVKDNGAAAAPTVEYKVPAEVKQQPDLLVTALLDRTKVNNVTLTMNHALSCVSFCATGLPAMKVKKITLNNIYGRGTLALDDVAMKWTVDPASKNITVMEPGVNSDKPLEENPTTGNYLMTTDGFLMMVPQKLTDATIDVTYWNGTAGSEQVLPYTLPTTIDWEPGKKYIYKFGEANDEVVVYYEKYSDETYGFQSTNTTLGLTPISDTKAIVEAGYGVLSRSRLVGDTPKIKLEAGAESSEVATKKIPAVVGGYNLYAVSQTSIAGSAIFTLPTTTVNPAALYFNGNSLSCGKIIPHFAKGVTPFNPQSYAIRTPQQMRNLSEITNASASNPTASRTFVQERDLDFAAAYANIGGGDLTAPVVDDEFWGTYNSDLTKSISHVKITSGANNVGLFSTNNGRISQVVLKSSTISGADAVGGIAGKNGGTIDKSQIIGTADNPTDRMSITGTSNVGGIAGTTVNTINGNTAEAVVNEITIPTVSGWVNISAGTGANVGGIAGSQTWGNINTTLVYGVVIKGSTVADLTPAGIKISGGQYVGGIVGVNSTMVNGNKTAAGKNMPDVAGVVDISGTNWVGGITGFNFGTGTLNSVNIRSGRVSPTKIVGTGVNIGGIVGENYGTLGVNTTELNANSFISIRGNFIISGQQYVGGIVGKNSSGVIENCFVYDYQSQAPVNYYAPQIVSTNGHAGGIAGINNGAAIKNCGVVSARTATLLITSPSHSGGIAGFNATGSETTNCSVLGRVKVDGTANAGGIFGASSEGTTLSDCWIGTTDGKGHIAKAIAELGLNVTPPSGTVVYGTPIVTGTNNIGGIVGFNSGVVQNITLSDNVIIGRADVQPLDGSNFVGGIVGGNAKGNSTTSGVVKNCKVINVAGKIITIRGSRSIGGVVGLNNGLVTDCSASGTSNAILTISGLGTIGGIVGQNGGSSSITTILGAGTGNDFTIIRNCTVTGYVSLQGHSTAYDTATEVGGIVGLNGPNKDNINNVYNCSVRGSAANSITIFVAKVTGGIVGTNSGRIMRCDIENAKVTTGGTYAGGIVGQTGSTAVSFAENTSNFRSDISDCRVYSANISGGTFGTLIGLNDTGDITGTTMTFGSVMNYVYGGTAVGQTTTKCTVNVNCTVGTVPPR